MDKTGAITLRIAQNKADARSASRIYALSWKSAYRGLFSDQLLDSIGEDDWTEKFQSNDTTGRFEVALLQYRGKDVGACAYGVSRDYGQDWGEVTSIYLLPESWGKGFARPLMEHALKRLAEQGLGKVHLWVVEGNLRARAFYEKCGFTPSGRRERENVRGETQYLIEYVRQAQPCIDQG